MLGSTRAAIAAEKLAVAGPGSVVVLPDDEFAALAPRGEVRIGGRRRRRSRRSSATAGRWPRRACPGRLEIARRRNARRRAHARGGRLAPRAAPEPHDYVVVASILGDKDAAGILDRLARAGARSSRPPRRTRGPCPPRRSPTWPARASRASTASPTRRPPLALARDLGGPVLVTGSLYLLADLADDDRKIRTMTRARERTHRLSLRALSAGPVRRARVCRGLRGRKDPAVIASTFGGVHDFFHSSTWYVMRNLAIFFVIVFWVAIDLLGLQGRPAAHLGHADRLGRRPRSGSSRSSGR